MRSITLSSRTKKSCLRAQLKAFSQLKAFLEHCFGRFESFSKRIYIHVNSPI